MIFDLLLIVQLFTAILQNKAPLRIESCTVTYSFLNACCQVNTSYLLTECMYFSPHKKFLSRKDKKINDLTCFIVELFCVCLDACFI